MSGPASSSIDAIFPKPVLSSRSTTGVRLLTPRHVDAGGPFRRGESPAGVGLDARLEV